METPTTTPITSTTAPVITSDAPVISPITANLLAALRSLEASVDYYYSAVTAFRNPSDADWPVRELTPEETEAFGAVRALTVEAPAGGAACHQSDDPDADGHQAHAPGPLRLRAFLSAVEVASIRTWWWLPSRCGGRLHPGVEVCGVEVAGEGVRPRLRPREA